MDLKDTMPPNFPVVYGFADQFFSKVEPSLDKLLSKYSRVYTLSQTIGASYDSFQPFLLDYPEICKILSGLTVRDEKDWKTFWNELQKVSVQAQFEKTKPSLKALFDQSYKSLSTTKGKPHLGCDIKKVAFNSISELAPDHIDSKVFSSAFAEKGPYGRGERIEAMHFVCNVLQKQFKLDHKLVDLYNLIVYRNSFAWHAYERINTILNGAREHARGDIKITVPGEEYVFYQWKEVMVWYGANKKLQEISKNIFANDPDGGKFISMVFYLRDFELKVDPIGTKTILLRSFLSNRPTGKRLLRQIVTDHKFCAPIWVRKAVNQF